VTAVIFVAAISEFDQTLYEDDKVNRLTESLGVFSSVCNNKYFAKTAMILFLNKIDLFEEKIKRTSISQCFPDYSGDNSLVDSAEFIRNKFLEQNQQNRLLFSHITCATDTQNIQKVFDVCRVVILKENLRDLGM
jgi:hypothetical protein